MFIVAICSKLQVTRWDARNIPCDLIRIRFDLELGNRSLVTMLLLQSNIEICLIDILDANRIENSITTICLHHHFFFHCPFHLLATILSFHRRPSSAPPRSVRRNHSPPAKIFFPPTSNFLLPAISLAARRPLRRSS